MLIEKMTSSMPLELKREGSEGALQLQSSDSYQLKPSLAGGAAESGALKHAGT